MSYLVLARKYRPRTLGDLVGQGHVVRTLENAMALGRVHHAFLFTGARGVGKTSAARALARALNCEKGPTAQPCMACPSCLGDGQGTDPDVIEIDGASNNGVDHIRELRESVRYLPTRGSFRIFIIDEVHMLTQAAFNALLKTLEEPPEHVKFFFATTEPHKIPTTILSRCQRFDFRRVAPGPLAAHLSEVLAAESCEVAPAALSQIVREAQGSVRDALSLLDQVLSYAGSQNDGEASAPGSALSIAEEQVVLALGLVDRQSVFDVVAAALSRDATAMLELIDEIDGRGHDLVDLASLVVELLRDLAVAQVHRQPQRVLASRSPSEIAALVELASSVSEADLSRLFRLASDCADDVARSGQPRISLEMGLLRLLHVESAASIDGLLTRLTEVVDGSVPPEPRETSGNSGGGSGGSVASGHRARHSTVQVESPKRCVSASVSAPAPALNTTAMGHSSQSTASRPQSDVKPSVGGRGWPEFLRDVVRTRSPGLGSVMAHARVVEFGPELVRIAFDSKSFHYEAAVRDDGRALLIELLGDFLGGTPGLEIVTAAEIGAGTGDTSMPHTEAERAVDAARRRREQIEQAAVSHPGVQDAISILGGVVKAVVSTPETEGE